MVDLYVFDCVHEARLAETERERDEARAEVERLRGLCRKWASELDWKAPTILVEMQKEGEKR